MNLRNRAVALAAAKPGSEIREAIEAGTEVTFHERGISTKVSAEPVTASSTPRPGWVVI